MQEGGKGPPSSCTDSHTQHRKESVLLLSLPRATLLTGRFFPRSGIYPDVFVPDDIGGRESGKKSRVPDEWLPHQSAVVSLASFPGFLQDFLFHIISSAALSVRNDTPQVS